MTSTGGRTYFLRTTRLGFGRWHEADLPLARDLWGDARVTRLFGGPFPETQVRERLAREIANEAALGIQYWPLFLLADGSHVGCGGLRPCDRPRTLELGFHLRPAFWGRGLATEAARAIAAHAFGTLGVDALFAGHHPDNRDSARVLAKLGFRSIGEELYEPTGLMHPSYLLRKAAWESRKP